MFSKVMHNQWYELFSYEDTDIAVLIVSVYLTGII